MDRLESQLAFIREIDKLKGVLRQTWLLDMSRKENSAEHAWQVALMAVVLAEHADRPVEVARVVEMLLVHDLVEIDAGDTFLYDEAAVEAKAEAETRAADRLFGLLPADQRDRLRALWDEFEQGTSPDAAFARALDRFAPLMHNVFTDGATWKDHGVTVDQVMKMNARIGDGSEAMWALAKGWIEAAVKKGDLPPR